MKLTNYLRDAFISRVMNDVPESDYQSQATDVLDEDVVDQFPPKVRAVWDDKSLQHLIGNDHSHRHFSPDDVPGSVWYLDVAGLEARDEARRRATELLKKAAEQKEQRAALRSKLRAVVYGCRTRKQLAEALPEFVKYMPAEAAKSDRTVPVVVNVVSEFVQAGWPKEQVK